MGVLRFNDKRETDWTGLVFFTGFAARDALYFAACKSIVSESGEFALLVVLQKK
jgi:hypothetical protein